MEAGHHMHQFTVDLFKQLDSGHHVDNLYMLNGHLQDSLKSLFEKRATNYLDRM
jgi:hypothetical protein